MNNESQPECGEAVSVLVCMVEPNFVCLECVSGDRVCESERGVWCASCLRHTVVCRVATAPDEDKSGRDVTLWLSNKPSCVDLDPDPFL